MTDPRTDRSGYGPAWAKREAIRRQRRARGIVAVPSVATLENVVREHEAAARLGIAGHDDLCERGPSTPCYCAERAEAIERVNANAQRAGLDTDADAPITSP